MKEGTKYDNGKLRLAEMIIDFKIPMEELCKVWEFGANKYEKSNWKKLANPIDRYTNAMLRHLLAEEVNPVDDESKLLHAAHIAFNALARLHFIVKNKGIDTKLTRFYEFKEGQVPNELDVRPGTITPMEWSEGGKNG